MAIREIENLTENEAKEMAVETMVIKDHNIYFVNFDDAFGYSALVFKNGHHIHYANDYQLHHGWMVKEKGMDALRQWYIDTMNHKLYTETELQEPLKDYDDYKAKEYYLRNYYPMQIDYVSIFAIGEKAQAEVKRKAKGMQYNPVSFCYMKDVDFVKKQVKLLATLLSREAEMKETPEYWIKAFKHEMYNHEYSINWDADPDTLSVFGNIPREITWNREWKLSELFDALDFTQVQRNAYIQARREYYQEIDRQTEYELDYKEA